MRADARVENDMPFDIARQTTAKKPSSSIRQRNDREDLEVGSPNMQAERTEMGEMDTSSPLKNPMAFIEDIDQIKAENGRKVPENSKLNLRKSTPISANQSST